MRTNGVKLGQQLSFYFCAANTDDLGSDCVLGLSTPLIIDPFRGKRAIIMGKRAPKKR